MDYVFKKNCSFHEWYQFYKLEIIDMFHSLLNWLIENDFQIECTKKTFYKKFVRFVYKNSTPYIY